MEDFDFQILSRKGISAFIFDQSWQDDLDSITLVTSASYEALSRKVFCVVIGIPKHWLVVIEQEFYVSVRFFFLKSASLADFLLSQPSKNHQCVLGCYQFQNGVSGSVLLVLLRFVNAVVVKVRGKDP